MKRALGKVTLIGAGPGAPDLITVRGRALLRAADVVVVDALVNARTLSGIRGRVMYVGKRGHLSDSTPQTKINSLLVRLGRQGKQVVRLKGGDPFVFGRGN